MQKTIIKTNSFLDQTHKYITAVQNKNKKTKKIEEQSILDRFEGNLIIDPV